VDLAGLEGLLVVVLVAAVAPLVAAVLPGPRIAQVVVLLVGGVLIGPQVLGVPTLVEIELIANVGVGFLFLLAGYELDPVLFKQRAGRLAMVAWVASLAVAVVAVTVLELTGVVGRDFVPVVIALTTTALGTLLPILRDNDMLGGAFGRHMLAGGAVGELFPIVAIAIFLSAGSQFVAVLALVVTAALGALLIVASRGVRGRALERLVLAGADTTAQSTLRWTIALLLALLVATAEFGIDAVLGAFVAGMVLRRWVGEGAASLAGKLDAVGYGFFIPVFFVFSGMNLDIVSLLSAPQRVLGFLLLLLLARALPVFVVHARALPRLPRVQLALCSATTLPLLVALAEIGRRNGTMPAEDAAALVGAGVLSVLLFPTVAVALQARLRAAAPEAS
jgi:Kef-type K+ transport system membrane component KefB